MSPFSWQCQNLCLLSLTSIIDWRVVTPKNACIELNRACFSVRQGPSVAHTPSDECFCRRGTPHSRLRRTTPSRCTQSQVPCSHPSLCGPGECELVSRDPARKKEIRVLPGLVLDGVDVRQFTTSCNVYTRLFYHRFLDITNKWIWRILKFRKKSLSLGENSLSLGGKSLNFRKSTRVLGEKTPIYETYYICYLWLSYLKLEFME